MIDLIRFKTRCSIWRIRSREIPKVAVRSSSVLGSSGPFNGLQQWCVLAEKAQSGPPRARISAVRRGTRVRCRAPGAFLEPVKGAGHEFDERPGRNRAFSSPPAIPVGINRRIVADDAIWRAVVVRWRTVGRSIIDRWCGSSRQCSSEQSKSKSGANSRAAPTVMMPMGRSRRNRSDEERCCRDHCKSKLSHVSSLN